MQNRPIVYDLAQIRSFDTLNGWVDTLVGDANALQVALGQTGTVIQNLILTATSPSSLILNLTQGWIAALAQVDTSSYGSLPADTSTVLQLGQSNQSSVTISNTLAAGHNQYVLIQAGFISQDSIANNDPNDGVLPYVNVSNPSDPLNGPGNSGIAQDTVRSGICNISVKYGTPALTGSAVAPAPDAGYVPVALINLTAGQTGITQGQILNPNAVVGYAYPSPVLAGLLNSHHNGLPGQAPQIILGGADKEVQGELATANMVASNTIGAVATFRNCSGNPNGQLAGNANTNGAADLAYDQTNKIFYVCTTTGPATGAGQAVWTGVNLTTSRATNVVVFTTSGSYTPSVGTTNISVTCVGGGGGGTASYQSGPPGGVADCGGGGGGGSTVSAKLPTSVLTFPATITVGTGGAGGSTNGAVGTNGGNSSFQTAQTGTALTGYGGGAQQVPSTSSVQIVTGGPGGGAGQPLSGTITIGSNNFPYTQNYGSAGGGGNPYTAGSPGGSSSLGGGGNGGQWALGGTKINPTTGGYGGGGGGGAPAGDNSTASIMAGANGVQGIVIITEQIGS